MGIYESITVITIIQRQFQRNTMKEIQEEGDPALDRQKPRKRCVIVWEVTKESREATLVDSCSACTPCSPAWRTCCSPDRIVQPVCSLHLKVMVASQRVVKECLVYGCDDTQKKKKNPPNSLCLEKGKPGYVRAMR